MKRAQNRSTSNTAQTKTKSSIQQPSPSPSPVKAKAVRSQPEPSQLKKKTTRHEEILPQKGRNLLKTSPKMIEESESEEIIAVQSPSVRKKSPVRSPIKAVATESPSKAQIVKVDEGVKVIFVGNIPVNASREDIQEYFSGCGKVMEVRLAFSQQGISKGYAHVEFDSTNAVRKAVVLNGKDFLGRPLRIDPSKPSKTGEYKKKKVSQSVKPAAKKTTKKR